MYNRVHLAGKFLAVLLLTGFSQASMAVLNGDYDIGGTNPDFITISAAVNALNSQGISGPVDFIINSGTYNEQVTIQSISRSGNADDMVTFRKSWPWIGVTWKYSSPTGSDNFVLKLVGATYVNIRGIHFQAEAGAAPYGNLVVLSAGAANISISGATFTGLVDPHSDDGSLVLQTGAGGNSNFELIGNNFINGYNAIDMDLPGTGLVGLLVDDNSFTDQEWSGVISNSRGAIITNNDVVDGATAAFSYTALLVTDDSATIDANVIDIQHGLYAISNLANTGTTLAGRVSNNMVSSNHNGIRVSASNTSIYHNTVSVSDWKFDEALKVFGTATQIRINNNILTHDGTGGVALEIEAGVSIESSNNNNLYSAGEVPLVTYGASDYNTLADYQAARGLDPDSVSVAVSYSSNSVPYNLHLAGASATSVDLVAPFLADISEDIDGQARDTRLTFMGADEGSGVEPLDNADSASGSYYTVGGSTPDFADPTVAIYHLNKRGTKAPVTFRVRAGTYDLNATIRGIMRFGAVDDLVFFRSSNLANKPVFQHTASGADDNWIIRLIDADYVGLWNFVFNNQGNDAFSRLLYLQGDVGNFDVRLNEFNGATAQTGTAAALVFSDSPQQDIFSFEDNSFNDGSYGLYLTRSSDLDVRGAFLNVSGNTFSGQLGAVHTDRTDVTVDGNMFTSDLTLAVAVHLQNNNVFAVKANKIDLSGFASTGINLQKSIGQNLSDATAVTNNFIVAYTGIDINSDSAIINIANNSIVADFYPVNARGTSLGIYLIDNILINSSSGPAYSYGGTLHQLQQEDYNVLVNTSGDLVSLDGVAYADMAAYQAAMQVLGNSYGEHSKTIAVNFTDSANADLHLAGDSVGDPELAGLPLNYVTDDFDGQTRSLSLPYIGADEVAAISTASFIFTSAGSLVVSEDGTTDTFTVELNSQPSDDVTLGLSVSVSSHASLSESSLTFTSADWNVPQEVLVTGIDDNIISVDGGVYFVAHKLSVITAAAVSADASYDGINPPNPGLLVNETTSTTLSIRAGGDAAEPSANGHFVITIDNGTTSNVDTAVSGWLLSGSATENTDYSLLPAGLVIRAGASSSDVFITPIDDLDYEGSETIVFTLTAIDHDERAMGINSRFLAAGIDLLDDEPAPAGELSVTVSNGFNSVEDGEALSYTIQISNSGGVDIAQALVLSSTPLGGLVNLGWTCLAGSGASCAGAGSGDISDNISLDAGASVTYTMLAIVDASPGAFVKMEVIAKPKGETEPQVIAEDKDLVRVWFKDGFE